MKILCQIYLVVTLGYLIAAEQDFNCPTTPEDIRLRLDMCHPGVFEISAPKSTAMTEALCVQDIIDDCRNFWEPVLYLVMESSVQISLPKYTGTLRQH